MAIDPQFITLDHVEDFAEIGGEEALAEPLRARLDAARIAPRIQYAEVRELKNLALRRCFARFRVGGTGERNAPRRGFSGVRDGTGVVARRVRAVSCPSCAARRARLVRLARAAARAASPTRSTRARAALADEILFRQYAAVARRRPVASSARAHAGTWRFSATFRSW